MRAFSVFWRLVPYFVAFLRDRRRWIIFGRPRPVSANAQSRRADSLVATLAALGPTYIKLAQVFASRPDIIPEPYLAALGQLTDRVPPLSEDVIRAVIASEYGKPVADVFQRFDSAPLAAASLGQVHRALVNGQEVAVKVLRPGVEELVAVDLDAAFRILFFLHVVFPNHHTRAITTIVREFAKRIEEEMDFHSEARNAELIRNNFAADSRVKIPAVIGELTRRRVLVLEYVEGTKIDRLHERMQSGDVSLPALLETIVEVYVKMMLVDGVFHADPHPGNLLLSPDGRLILLDFGMVIQVEKETRARLITTVMAVARRDVDGVVAGMYELGLLDPEVDRGTIRDAARALMAIAFTYDTRPKQIQRVVNEVMSTFYQWPVTLPSELVYFGRAAALIEGIGARYDELFNSAQFVAPIIARKKGELIAAMLGDDPRHMVRDWVTELAGVARELRDVLKRAGRDEIRIRAHPRDVIEMQQYIGRQTRRLLLCIFAAMVAIVGTLLYLADGNTLILVASLMASAFTYLIVFLIPAHLLSNPFRRVRLRR